MDGNNNPAFIKMIEAQLNKWNAEEIDIEYNTSIDSVEAIANSILELK